MRHTMIVRLWLSLCLVVMTGAMGSAYSAKAQLLGGNATPAAEAATDPFGRDTPRSTVTGLLRSLGDHNYAATAPFLALPPNATDDAPALAVALRTALDSGGSLLPYAELSNEAGGRVSDGLAPDLEQVGTLGGEAAVPILLQRRQGDDGVAYWQIAPDTLQALTPTPNDAAAARAEAERDTVAGAPLRDWITLVGLLLLAFMVFWLVSRLILYLACRFMSKEAPVYRVLHAALPPVALFLALLAFRIYGENAEVSIIARQTLLRYGGILGVVALVWFGLRLVDALAHGLTARMERTERRQAASVIVFAKRVIKVILLGIGLIAILDTLGFNVTTGIAALGIGGLVLALGAQKSVENLVGTVTVLADRPVQVGDFCRVGDVMGTIEDIGIRSTRIRTNERTVVTIPNGDFSSQRIENFSLRDRFLFQVFVKIDHTLDADRVREAVAIVADVLSGHPRLLEEPRRAALKEFAPDSLSIETFAYIDTVDYPESVAVRQELLLTILHRFHEAGIAIIAPLRPVYLTGDAPTGDQEPRDKR